MSARLIAGTRLAQAPLRVRRLGFASQMRTLRYACAILIFPLNIKKTSTKMNQTRHRVLPMS